MESSWVCSELDISQIRLLVFQDCERRGRQVLFDSTTIRKQASGEETQTKPPPRCHQTPSISTQNHSQRQREPSPSYQYTRPASDANMLGEMMFGSVAMSYKGSTLKIHRIRSPPQLMVSKVFSARVGSSTGSTNALQDSFEYVPQDSGPSQGGSGSHSSSSSSSCSIAHSTPVDMPGRGRCEDGDSGIARSASLATPLASPGSTPSSCSSYQRRLQRSYNTSLEHHTPRGSDERFSQSDESCNSAGPTVARRRMIALSVIITLPDTEDDTHSPLQDREEDTHTIPPGSQEDTHTTAPGRQEDTHTTPSDRQEDTHTFTHFFFSHFPLIEAHINKLKMAVERAMVLCRQVCESGQRLQVYVTRVMDALAEFRTAVWNLYMAPRISEPVWLTMVSQNAERGSLCQRFLQELSLLMDTSSKSQFLSSLLTAVLTHHLAWIPTVTPSNQPPITALCEKRTSQSVDMLAKSHPYNPLWAQLGDLYGALGSPVRVCRTVVVGRKRDQVQRLLYVLSYFIRCSHLQEHTPTVSLHTHLHTHTPTDPSLDTSLEKGELEQSEYVVVSCPPSHTPCPQAQPITGGLEVEQEAEPQGEIFLVCGLETHRGEGEGAGRGEEGEGTGQTDSGEPCEFGGLEQGQCGMRVRSGRGRSRRRGEDLPRNESSDSALGDSGDETLPQQQSTGEELELPLPRFEAVSAPCVCDFGRSLLGGFSPHYLADFALHGTASDERLLQCLMGDLEHAVLYPVLDEPVAEAVCVVADVERVCVQVASSQRRTSEPRRLGPDVRPSTLVSNLLLSTLQLHRLGLGPEYCISHLEDHLQELYFRSRLLAEYLRGHTRISTKELALALGIECDDIPLLAALASTHSPHVAQVLL